VPGRRSKLMSSCRSLKRRVGEGLFMHVGSWRMAVSRAFVPSVPLNHFSVVVPLRQTFSTSKEAEEIGNPKEIIFRYDLLVYVSG